MKQIFEPVKMNPIVMKNRLIRSATWEGIANPDGSITEEAYEIYAELAKGGVGAIITGFTSVALHDYYFEGMMRLWDDALIPQYQKLVEVIHAEGTPVIAQLALGAYYRKKNGRFQQIEPDDMTVDEIQSVIRQFIDAAVRAKKAGFDGIRKEAPTLHITIKINSDDFTYGGLNESESLAICRLLDAAGIDSIEVSGNGTSVGGIRPHVNEGYFAPFAAAAAEEVFL